MTHPRRAYTPEQHLSLLINGLTGLQTKIAAGERVPWRVQIDDSVIPDPAEKIERNDDIIGLLDIQGGYVPGRYALADKIVREMYQPLNDEQS